MLKMIKVKREIKVKIITKIKLRIEIQKKFLKIKFKKLLFLV